MKGLSGLTVRYMTKNWKRTLTTLVGVFFAALLIFLMFEVTESVTGSMRENDVRLTGGKDMEIVVSGETALQMKKDAGTGDAKELAGVQITNLWITCTSGDADAYDSFEAAKDPMVLSQGKYPAGEGEIIVDPAEMKGVQIGDDITLGEQTYRVTGFFKNKEHEYVRGYTMISDENIGKQEAVSVQITVKDKKDLEGQLAAIASKYPSDYAGVSEASLIFYGQSGEGYKDLGRNVMILLLAMVFAAFLMVIIRNAFNISVDERMKDYGILRCIGLTKGQIFKMILLEAFLVALIGSLAGILVGYGITAGGLSLASMLQVVEDSFGKGFSMHTFFSPTAILMTVGLIFLTTILSMVSPIQKLFKMAPIAAQRKADSVSRPGKNQSLLNKGGKNISLAYGIRSAKRSKGRFARTVITYALGLALVVGFGNILKTMLATEYPALHSYDYSGITGSETKWAELIGTLRESDHCKGVEGILNYCEFEKSDSFVAQADISVAGLTSGLWEHVLEETALAPAADSKDVVEVVLVAPTIGDKAAYQVGDTFKLTFSDKTFHVAGRVSEAYINLLTKSNGQGLFDANKGQYVYEAKRGETVFGDFKAEASGVFGSREASIDGSLSAEAKGSVKELSRIMDESLDQTIATGGTFAVLGAIRSAAIAVLAFLLLIAVVNAINVCRGQLNVRKDEIRTLRLIGMSEKQRQRMLLAENMFASVLAAIVGPILGTAASFGVTKMMYNGNGLTGSFDPFEMSMHFSIDWGIVIIAMVAVLISGFVVTFFNRKDS